MDAKYLHPFGCLVWYKVPEANRKKLYPKGRASMLLSYLANGNSYRLWDLESRTVIKSRDVVFRDDVFPYKHPIKQTSRAPVCLEIDWPLDSPVVQPFPVDHPSPICIGIFRSDRRLQALNHNPDNAVPIRPITPPLDPPTPPSPVPSPPSPVPPTPSAPLPPPSPPCRSSRVRKAPVRYGIHAKPATDAPASSIDVPKTWKKVLRSPNKDKWMKAADAEFASILGMKTWKLVPWPVKRKIIKSKWVSKPKLRPDGSIAKLKARLVAMGYTQKKCIDFDEVFAPTTRFETLCLLLSLMGSKSLGGYQINFTAAFLNGHLDHPVYMTHPPGYEGSKHPDYVFEVTNSLYGLKKSPRQWKKALHTLLVSLGLTQSKFDPTLYFKIQDGKLVCAVAFHVDDLAIIGEESVIQPLMDSLEKTYKVGQREELSHFLSLKITRDKANKLVYLSQSHYVRDIHAQFLPNETCTAKTPTALNFKDLGPSGSLADMWSR